MLVIKSIWHWLTGENPHHRFKAAHLLWLYPLVGLYTFGYDAALYPTCGEGEQKVAGKTWEHEPFVRTIGNPTNEVQVMGTIVDATIAGALWPFFWAWEALEDTKYVSPC